MSNTEERIIHMHYSELAQRERIIAKIFNLITSEEWDDEAQVEIGVSLHMRRKGGNHIFKVLIDPVLGRMNREDWVFVGSFQKAIFSGKFADALLEHMQFQENLIDAAKAAEARKA